MPKLILDEPEVTIKKPHLVLDESVGIKKPFLNLIEDTPEKESVDIERVLRNYFEKPVANSLIINLFRKGNRLVEGLAQKVEEFKTPFVEDTSLWRYFPAYLTSDLIRMYTPTRVALATVIGAGLGKVGVGIKKITPELIKQALGKKFVYRFGQLQPYQEIAEKRIAGIAKGFEEAQKTGEILTKGLSKAEQLRLGQIMRGGITTSPKLQALSEPARKLVDDLSKELIKQGVPNERLSEVIENNLGVYLPRLYRVKEVESSLGRLFGSKKPIRIDLSRLKRRKDMPLLVRQKMGEIIEPAYPTAKAIGQMTQMTETAKLFNSVAGNPEWTSDIAKEGFVKMADSKALGRLANKWVLQPIADDINDIVTIQPDWYRNIYKPALSAWKAGKTILNPATHSRNMMSNTILLDLSGVNHAKQTVLLPRALRELATKGKYYQEAQTVNLLGHEYYAAEIRELIDKFPTQSRNLFDFALRLVAKPIRKAGNIYQAEEQWFKLAKFISERERGIGIQKAAQEAEKWLFNYQKVTPFIRKVAESPFGMPFIRFTYKALPRIAETITENPMKIYKYIAVAKAFESASAKSLGMSQEELREAKSLLPEWLRGLGKYGLLLPTRDKSGRTQYLDLTYILPIGLVSNITEQGGILGLMSNPMTSWLWEVGTNKQRFSGREIWSSTDTAEEIFKKISDYTYRQIMPSLAPPIPPISKGGYAWQKLQSAIKKRPDYFGRERELPTTVLDVLAGVKITPVDIQQQQLFQLIDKQKTYQDLRKQMYRVIQNKSLKPEERERELEKINEKVRNLFK